MLAEVANGHVIRQLILDEVAGRARQQHLSAVASRTDAGRAVNRKANQARLRGRGLAGVQPHAHAKHQSVWPRMRSKCPLGGDYRPDRIFRTTEGDEEGIALAVQLLTAPLPKRGPQQPVVIGKQRPVAAAQFLQQPSRPLDVREEEGDRPTRQLRHPGLPATIDTGRRSVYQLLGGRA